MSDIFFEELHIKEPDYYLGVGSWSHGKQIAEIIKKAEDILVVESPEAVLVYGDTNSTLGGALASKINNIPVVHIESGMRSYNKDMPEEANRILTDHISTILFCSSRNAVLNLKKEGFKNIANNGYLIQSNVYLKKRFELDINNPLVINTGDIMYYNLIYSSGIVKNRSSILKKLKLKSKKYYLFTMHRAENIDRIENLKKIITFINKVSKEEKIILPMHPRFRKGYKGINSSLSERVMVIDPVGYLDMLALLQNAKLLFTDSGGMQKEAYWLGIHCVTLRKETEWKETIESNWNLLYSDYKGFWVPKKTKENFYGDGKAAERVAHILIKIFAK